MTPRDLAMLVVAELELAHERGELVDDERVAAAVLAHTTDDPRHRHAVLMEARLELGLPAPELADYERASCLRALAGVAIAAGASWALVWLLALLIRSVL